MQVETKNIKRVVLELSEREARTIVKALEDRILTPYELVHTEWPEDVKVLNDLVKELKSEL